MPDTAPTPLQALVQRRLEELGQSAFEAAEGAGLDRQYIYELATGKKQSFRLTFLPKISAALQISSDEVLEAMNAQAIDAGRKAPRVRHEVRKAEVAMPYRSELPRDLPVYGTAAGSIIGNLESFDLNTVEIVEYVARPPALAKVPTAYSVYVVGESMVPAHDPGDLRFVHPGKAPRHGDTVILQVKNGEHQPYQFFIKRFIKNTGRGVLVEQYNPPAQMEFMRETVVAVHKVLTMAELFGV